jgi:ankyrin repeat protein
MLRKLLKLAFQLIVFICFSTANAGIYDAFFKAVELDDARAVIRLLQRGFDVNSPGPDGHSPLAMAVQLDSHRVADVLLRVPGISVDQANAQGETALMYAAVKGSLEWAQRLVKQGAQVRRATGWTPLHYAASGPEPGVVGFLLDAGADVDAVSPDGSTALMLAARYGDERIIDMLLQRGADPQLKNPHGAVAADYARVAGRDRLASRLEKLTGAGVSPSSLSSRQTRQ